MRPLNTLGFKGQCLLTCGHRIVSCQLVCPCVFSFTPFLLSESEFKFYSVSPPFRSYLSILQEIGTQEIPETETAPPGQQGSGWSPLHACIQLASPMSPCLGFRSVQCNNCAGQQDTKMKKTHPMSRESPAEGVDEGRDRQREAAKQCSWQQMPG